jgi:type IV pilus assembly protein PilB
MSRKLVELFLRERIITDAQFKEAETQLQVGTNPLQFLIDRGAVSETRILAYLSQKFGLPSINLDKFEVSPDIIKLITPEMARKVHAIPIQASKGTLVAAVYDPTNLMEIQNLKFQLKMNVEAVLTSFGAFERALQKYYGGSASMGVAVEAFKRESTKLSKKEDAAADFAIEQVEVHQIDQQSVEQDGPVIALVNGILSEGIRHMASDIHVEPYEHRFRVRIRQDGTLREVMEIPKEMKRAVLARLKIMSRMDIAETRIPQDGRIKLKVSGRDIDFRVNTLPTLFGEKIVLRMLNKGNLQLDLRKLGFEDQQLALFRKGISAPNGLVLVTGPTGSGKTTTLYSALAELNQVSDNLSTVEDPVEYNLEGINQVQIQKDVGLTFASALRSLLRQDPDTVLVGEIRDYETAEVAVQAALTGHLVLSTLHTNDAPATVVRLLNMGLEPFLVTSSVNTIVAQRLLRTVCAKCKKEYKPPMKSLLDLGFTEASANASHFFKGDGCQLCNKTGYKGRVAIYEVMDFSQNLKEMVLKGATAIELKRAAISEGMKSLRMSALTKAAEGRTTIEEAVSLTMEN